MTVLLLWLSVGVPTLTLLDEEVMAPAGGWRSLAIALRQRPAVLECTYTVRRGAPVRLWLIERSELPKFSTGRLRPLAISGPHKTGELRQALRLGDFVLIVDNRLEARQAAELHLRVSLVFAAGQAGELPPDRRRLIVGLSLAYLLALSWWAWRRLGPKLRAGLRQ